MSAASSTQVRTIPDWHVAWQCGPSGFADLAPLSGRRAVVAAGTLATTIMASGDADEARGAVRSVLRDRALVEGHDSRALFERANATLSASGLGRIDCLALLSRPADGVPASVSGRGHPAPLVVTPDHLAAPVDGGVAMDAGWTVVLGAADAIRPPHDMLSIMDVRTALLLLTFPAPAALGAPDRTLLAVVAS